MKKILLFTLLLVALSTSLLKADWQIDPKTGKRAYYAETSGYMGYMVPQAAD